MQIKLLHVSEYIPFDNNLVQVVSFDKSCAAQPVPYEHLYRTIVTVCVVYRRLHLIIYM